MGSAFRSRWSPAWVERAPVISLAVANVYVDNDEIERCVQQLLGTAAEVVVVVETTPAFRAEFDAAGGTERYPYRIFDPDDTSEYAVSLYRSLEPSDMAMVPIGELVGAAAHVPVGRGWLQVIGVLAQAAVDPGGMPRGSDRWPPWGDQRAPLVIAGDLNTRVYRAAYAKIRHAGLETAHRELGAGWRPSFALAARGFVARIGPLVRLDHALLDRWVWARQIKDLDNAGSDHRPFVVSLAVRAPRECDPGRAVFDVRFEAGSGRASRGHDTSDDRR